MKRNLIFYLLFISVAFISATQETSESSNNISFEQKDKEILEKILTQFEADKNLSTSELILKIGSCFKETPYVAHTIEMIPERLVINLRELDCTTFAENCLAIARTVKSKNPSFKKFTEELKTMRYHKGIINGYTSRIHYFSDWIFENSQKGLINDISKQISNVAYPLDVNFMSTHPESYKQLKEDPKLISEIVKQEIDITKRSMYYIPEDKIALYEDKLMDGDIAGITTNIKGMDIQHVVILIKQNGRIHILHASMASMKVILSEETLEDYLFKSKSATGVMIARPV